MRSRRGGSVAVALALLGCANESEPATAPRPDIGVIETSGYIPCVGTPPSLGPRITISDDDTGTPRGGGIRPGVYELREAFRSMSRDSLGGARQLRLTIAISDDNSTEARALIAESADGEPTRFVGGRLAFDAFGGLRFAHECGPPSLMAPGLLGITLGYTSNGDELLLYVGGARFVLFKTN